jgi:oligopeptide transport system substrate-binding protein
MMPIKLGLTLCLWLAALGLSGCDIATDDRPVGVNLIGGKARIVDMNVGATGFAEQIMASAVTQGLVSFNASGEIVPALAESWIVTDDGLSYIFRLKQSRWSDGRNVTADDVVRSLRLSLSANSRNPAKPYFNSISEIIAMTERVIEIRLKTPQPYILNLLARPEMGLVSKARGSGPLAVYKREDGVIMLRPLMPKGEAEDGAVVDKQAGEVRLRAESAALSIIRFVRGDATVVLGGGYADLPYVLAKRLPEDVLRRDPAAGLFGLVAASNSRVLKEPYMRRALAASIDRPSLIKRFGVSGWRPLETLLPRAATGVAAEAVPEWVDQTLPERRVRARQIVGGATPVGQQTVVRIALPAGPGSQILFAQLKADWRLIGITLEPATAANPADLRLIDSVAAYNGLGWYFGRLGCNQGFYCSADADAAIAKARGAVTEAERSAALSLAHEKLVADQIFIPLAFPLRWSLAAPDLAGFRENASNFHPVISLRSTVR